VESQLKASDPAENEIDTEKVDESPENLPLDTPSSLVLLREELPTDKSFRDMLTPDDLGEGGQEGDFVLRDEQYDER